MKGKHLVALLLVLVLSLGLLSGCSQDELGLINLMNQINDLDVFESQETISLNINKLPEELTGDDPAAVALVQNMLSRYSLKVIMQMDVTRGLGKGAFLLVDNDNNSEQHILSFVATGSAMYFKVDDLLALAKTFDIPEINSQLKVLGDAKYVSFTAEELAGLTGDPNAWATLDFSKLTKQRKLGREIMNGLTKQVFDGYTTGMVRKNNNQYVLTIDKKALLDNLVPFIKYSVNNVEKFQEFAVPFLNNLDSDELALLSLTPELRQTVVEEINNNVSDIINNREQLLSELSTLTAGAEQGLAVIGDNSKITVATEKTGSGQFKQTTSVVLSIADPEIFSGALELSLEDAATVNAIAPFTVDIPADAVSISELNNRMPRVLDIDAEFGEYYFNQGLKSNSGSIDIKFIKGSLFVPLRDVAVALNENIGWNSQLKKAYVVKNGKTIYLASTTVKGISFIKIKDFEKLGYTVTWDSELKIATISEKK